MLMAVSMSMSAAATAAVIAAGGRGRGHPGIDTDVATAVERTDNRTVGRVDAGARPLRTSERPQHPLQLPPGRRNKCCSPAVSAPLHVASTAVAVSMATATTAARRCRSHSVICLCGHAVTVATAVMAVVRQVESAFK